MNNNRRITLLRPSQIFDSFFDEFYNAGSRIFTNDLQIDMWEDEDNVYVNAKIGSVKKENLDIEVQDQMLTLTGQLSETVEDDNKKKKYYIKEIKEESFSRTIALPTQVDADKAEANVEDGMVKIKMPKRPEVKPKKLTISPK